MLLLSTQNSQFTLILFLAQTVIVICIGEQQPIKPNVHRICDIKFNFSKGKIVCEVVVSEG